MTIYSVYQSYSQGVALRNRDGWQDMDSRTSSELKQRLSAFLGRLAPPTAVKLATGLERARLMGEEGLPYDLIMSSLRPALEKCEGPRPGLSDPLRHFCSPFEGLLVDRRDPVGHARQILRTSIDPVWLWLSRELLPDALPDLTERIIEHTLADDIDALESSVAVLHASCSAALLSVMEETRKDVAQRRKLERQLGGDDILEDARLMGEALTVAPFLLEVEKTLPNKFDSLDDDQVALVSEIYKDASDVSPEHAIYVPLVLMSRLSAPWQVLRLARKVAGLGNDAALNRSGLSELGEIFLHEIEDIADRFEGQRPGKTDLNRMACDIKRFASISQGFIGEIDTRRVSDWGHRILAARAKLSASITEEMSRFQQDIAKALPLHQVGSYGKNGPRRPDVSHAPDAARVDKARCDMQFLKNIGPFADSIGVQAHSHTILQQVETYLVAYEDGLIEEIRKTHDDERENALACLNVVIGIRDMMGQAEAAAVLRRRARVAAQAV